MTQPILRYVQSAKDRALLAEMFRLDILILGGLFRVSVNKPKYLNAVSVSCGN